VERYERYGRRFGNQSAEYERSNRLAELQRISKELEEEEKKLNIELEIHHYEKRLELLKMKRKQLFQGDG